MQEVFKNQASQVNTHCSHTVGSFTIKIKLKPNKKLHEIQDIIIYLIITKHCQSFSIAIVGILSQMNEG